MKYVVTPNIHWGIFIISINPVKQMCISLLIFHPFQLWELWWDCSLRRDACNKANEKQCDPLYHNSSQRIIALNVRKYRQEIKWEIMMDIKKKVIPASPDFNQDASGIWNLFYSDSGLVRFHELRQNDSRNNLRSCSMKDVF